MLVVCAILNAIRNCVVRWTAERVNEWVSVCSTYSASQTMSNEFAKNVQKMGQTTEWPTMMMRILPNTHIPLRVLMRLRYGQILLWLKLNWQQFACTEIISIVVWTGLYKKKYPLYFLSFLLIFYIHIGLLSIVNWWMTHKFFDLHFSLQILKNCYLNDSMTMETVDCVYLRNVRKKKGESFFFICIENKSSPSAIRHADEETSRVNYDRTISSMTHSDDTTKKKSSLFTQYLGWLYTQRTNINRKCVCFDKNASSTKCTFSMSHPYTFYSIEQHFMGRTK